jgi:hypothetical protein
MINAAEGLGVAVRVSPDGRSGSNRACAVVEKVSGCLRGSKSSLWIVLVALRFEDSNALAKRVYLAHGCEFNLSLGFSDGRKDGLELGFAFF